MGNKAVVTGATGFLGLNLTAELKRLGWEVTAITLPGADQKYLNRLGVEATYADITDPRELDAVLPVRVDAVFHMAANTSAWARRNQRQYLDNVVGTRNMAKAAIAKGAGVFVYTSSISAFGYHPGKTIDEHTKSNALSCGMNYNKTKFIAEGIVKEIFASGPRAVILNPCNIVGPYDTNNWTRQFILPVYRGELHGAPPGRAMWCHVGDIVRAHIAAAERGKSCRNYLLGGTEASFKELINEIEVVMGRPKTERVLSKHLLRLGVAAGAIKSAVNGKEPLLTPEKYRRAVGDIRCDFSAARAELGYTTTAISQMIQDSYEWLRAEGLLPVEGTDGR